MDLLVAEGVLGDIYRSVFAHQGPSSLNLFNAGYLKAGFHAFLYTHGGIQISQTAHFSHRPWCWPRFSKWQSFSLPVQLSNRVCNGYCHILLKIHHVLHSLLTQAHKYR